MPKPQEKEPEKDEDEEPAEVEKVVLDSSGEDVESSLEELLARKAVVPAEEEESLLDLAPDDNVESLSIRAAPKQANEFVCSNCRLVKHNSQLADRKRQLCRDCV